MARRRPGLVAIRRVAAGVLVFAGLFVVWFGLGNGNQAIALSGAAVIMLALALRLVTTLRGSLRQWVVGVGRVTHVSEAPSATPYGRCQLELVVQVPDLPPETVIVREPRVPVDQWPQVGQELHVEVAADDVRNVRIIWPDSPAAESVELERESVWEDDQPGPVPAEPPGSHRDLDEDELDFDLEGPPSRGAATVSPADEGRPDRDVALVDTAGRRVPRPRPNPRPRPSPHPAAAAPASSPPVAAPPPEAFATYPSANPGPGGAIHRVGLTLLVSDLERSVAFYRDLLGFHEVDRGPDSVVLASGNSRLVLYASGEMGPVQRRVTHLNLDVADIHTLYSDLKAAGVRFTYGPRLVGQGERLEQWAAAFRDPDGHGVALTEWRAPTPTPG